MDGASESKNLELHDRMQIAVFLNSIFLSAVRPLLVLSVIGQRRLLLGEGYAQNLKFSDGPSRNETVGTRVLGLGL